MKEGEPGPRALRFRVTGRVQGVGFRYFVRRAARELGLVGRVRNLPDGAVEVEAAGRPEALAALRQVLAEGPPGARVGGLEEGEAAVDPAWDRFEIDP